MSRSAIYLVVFSLTEANEGRVDFWFRKIRAHIGRLQRGDLLGSSRAPIVLVGTHADEASAEQLKDSEAMVARLKEVYTFEGPFFVSCYSKSGGVRQGSRGLTRRELRAHLEKLARNTEVFPPIPYFYEHLQQLFQKTVEKGGKRGFFLTPPDDPFGRIPLEQAELIMGEALRERTKNGMRWLGRCLPSAVC